MDYEQKYNEALEKAKSIHDNPDASRNRKEWIEDIFPELAESEDERIRAVILKLVLGMRDEIFTTADKLVTKPKVLAWLGKLKEQKEIPLMNGDADLYFDEWNQQTKYTTTKRQCFEEGIRYAQRLQKEQNLELYYDKELDNAAREFYLSGGADSPVDSTGLVPIVRMAEFGATWMKERMGKEQKPIMEVFGFKVGDAVRLKDGDGRKHIIKSFEEVEGAHGPNFYHVEFEDDSARDGIYPGEEYPNGYYTQMEKFEEEQKPYLELKAGKWYICHRAYCARADHLTVKEGERFMCEKDGIVKGFVIKEPEKYFKECSAPEPVEKDQKPISTEDMPYITDKHFYEREPADSFKYKLAEYMTKCCTKKEGPDGFTYGISAETILKMAEEELLKRGVVQKPAELETLGKPMTHKEWAEDYWEHHKFASPNGNDKCDVIQFGHKGFIDFCMAYCVDQKPQDRLVLHDTFGYEKGRQVGQREGVEMVLKTPESYGLYTPAEWSEEDEKIVNNIVSVLGQYIDYKSVSGTGTGYATPRYGAEISWLKSLRPHWKPSEVQLIALDGCLEHWSGNKCQKEILESLYEQLKKMI